MKELVSIIIVNYNGKNLLKGCLDALDKCTYPSMEIILVDNASTDGSIEFIEQKYPKVKIKKLVTNLGFAKPNNIGAEMAKGNLLLFLNNDTIPNPNFLDELVKGFNYNQKIVACQSLLLKQDETVDSAGDFMDIYGRAYSSKKIPKDISYIFSAKGACMLIKKDIFLKLGGFDKKFFASFEDVDLGWRCWITGFSVVIVPQSVVYHLLGKTIKSLKDKVQFHGVKNSLIIRTTNFELRFLIKSVIVLAIDAISRRAFGMSPIRDPESVPPLPPFKIVFKAILWILRNIGYIIKKRKSINQNRKNTTKDLVKLNLIT